MRNECLKSVSVGHPAPESAVTSEMLVVSRQVLVSAIEAEIMGYFSCPSASGLTLAQGEVNYIIGGILRRLSD
jgi:hypothetical protein